MRNIRISFADAFAYENLSGEEENLYGTAYYGINQVLLNISRPFPDQDLKNVVVTLLKKSYSVC